jgi:hypothetical protein
MEGALEGGLDGVILGELLVTTIDKLEPFAPFLVFADLLPIVLSAMTSIALVMKNAPTFGEDAFTEAILKDPVSEPAVIVYVIQLHLDWIVTANKITAQLVRVLR